MITGVTPILGNLHIVIYDLVGKIHIPLGYNGAVQYERGWDFDQPLKAQKTPPH